MTQTSFMRLDAASMKTQKVLALIPSQFLSVPQCMFEHFVCILAFSLIWNTQSASSANYRFAWAGGTRIGLAVWPISVLAIDFRHVKPL